MSFSGKMIEDLIAQEANSQPKYEANEPGLPADEIKFTFHTKVTHLKKQIGSWTFEENTATRFTIISQGTKDSAQSEKNFGDRQNQIASFLPKELSRSEDGRHACFQDAQDRQKAEEAKKSQEDEIGLQAKDVQDDQGGSHIDQPSTENGAELSEEV